MLVKHILDKMIFYLLALVAMVSALPQPKVITNPMYAYHGKNTKIVGGVDASDGEFPWQSPIAIEVNDRLKTVDLAYGTALFVKASLQQNGRHFCGGSLITAGYVMTAAHCVVSSTVTVNLGAVDYRKPEQAIVQAVFTPHPSHNSATFDYDYAVITLASPASLGGNVNTIKLAEAGVEYTNPNMMASTSGWGYTTQFIQSTPLTMQKADIPLVSQEQCQSAWGTVIDITNRIQCAGGDGIVSSCMGDSGGPLTVVDNGETILIGAVSWVQSNCSPNYPGGYAKISAVRSWIDSIVN